MPGPGLSPVFALVLMREVSLNSGDSPGPGFTNMPAQSASAALSNKPGTGLEDSPRPLLMRDGRGLSSNITLATLINQRIRKCIAGQRIMPGPGPPSLATARRLSPVFALVLVREVSLNSGDSPGPGFTNMPAQSASAALSNKPGTGLEDSPRPLLMRDGRGLSSNITLATLINQRIRKCIAGQRIMPGPGPTFASYGAQAVPRVCARSCARGKPKFRGQSRTGFYQYAGTVGECSTFAQAGHWT